MKLHISMLVIKFLEMASVDSVKGALKMLVIRLSKMISVNSVESALKPSKVALKNISISSNFLSVLFAMQLFGILPLQGTLSGNFQKFKFKLLSWQMLHWMIVVASFLFVIIIALRGMQEGKMFLNICKSLCMKLVFK